MFDVGFSEIVVIAVVALVVIGPERLPKTARTIGHLLGRLQRYVADVKADIGREMELDELRKLQQQVHGAAQEIQQTVSAAANRFESGVRDVEQQLNTAGTPEASASPATDAAATDGSSEKAPPALSESAPKPDAPDDARQASLPGFDKI